jgi:ribosomal protein S18 acetylase RimI-like enzyme
MSTAMEITYRPRLPEELDDASRLIERVFREEFDLPLADRLEAEMSELKARFDEKRDLFTTAEENGRVVGALLITHDDEPESGALFSWLVVESAARGRGIGRELLFRGMETCRQRGLVLLRARSFAFSSAAPHLYWLHGFRVSQVTATEVAGRTQETLFFERRLTAPAG